MKKIKVFLIGILLICCAMNLVAKQISGDVIKVDNQGKTITLSTSSGDTSINIDKDSKLQKGIAGEKPLDVDIISISPGDFLTAEVNEKNFIVSATAKYKILSGTIKSVDNDTLTLEDSKKVKVSPTAMISLDNGQIGKIDQVKPGMMFYARINPNSGMIWTLIITGSKAVKPAVPAKEEAPRPAPKQAVEPVTVPVEVKTVPAPKPKEEIKPIVPSVTVTENDGITVTTTVDQMFTPEKPAPEPILTPMPDEPVAPAASPTAPVAEPTVTDPIAQPSVTSPGVKPVETSPAAQPTVTIKPADTSSAALPTPPKSETSQDLSIDTIELSYPQALKTNDLIMIKLTGTERAGTAVDVRYVPGTKVILKEDGLGSYVGFIKIPEKNLNKARIMVYMSKSGANISKESDYVLTVSDKTASIQNVPPAPAKPAETAPAASVVPAETAPVTPIETTPAVPAEPAMVTPEVPTVAPAITTPAITAPEAAPIQPEIPAVTVPESPKIITVTSPEPNSKVKEILVSGTAAPNARINIKITYSNNKSGTLSLSGIFKEDYTLSGENGEFTYGPLPLNGFFNSKHLTYTVTLTYDDKSLGNALQPVTFNIGRE